MAEESGSDSCPSQRRRRARRGGDGSAGDGSARLGFGPVGARSFFFLNIISPTEIKS